MRWGTRPEQRTVRTTLGQLGTVELEPPVTMVVGAVAELDLRWFEARPLFGRRIVVTRAREQASELVERLHRLGAETIELPAITIDEPDDHGAALRSAADALRKGDYRWVVFTSANAVERFGALLRDARDFGTAKVAAIGPGTADALRRVGVEADLVPSRFVAESLVDAFPPGEGRVLLPRAAVARDVLVEGLAVKGWQVTRADAYRTLPAEPTPSALAIGSIACPASAGGPPWKCSPAATWICALTRSKSVVASVIGCSTCSRVLTSRNANSRSPGW